MFTFDKICVGFIIASFVVFLIGVVIICYPETRREDDGGADRRPAAQVAMAVAPLPLRAPVERRPVAAPVEAKLGYFTYSAEGKSASEKLVCAICREVFEHGENCCEMPACRHLFHRDCVGPWMRRNTTCPLCRRGIVTGPERLSAADGMV